MSSEPLEIGSVQLSTHKVFRVVAEEPTALGGTSGWSTHLKIYSKCSFQTSGNRDQVIMSEILLFFDKEPDTWIGDIIYEVNDE